MTESELLVYYAERAVYLSNVATILFVVIGVLAILLIVCIGISVDATQERNRLREELEQHSDPAYQLALIRDLGETGRREVRRLADEAQRAMLAAGGRR